jgi:signal transduction histidine kinase
MFGSPRIHRVLAWSGAALAPLALVAALVNGAEDHVVHGQRYLLPALAVALPAGLLRRAPLPALALMLACAFIATTVLRSWEDGYLWGVRYLLFLMIDGAVGFIAAGRSWRISIPAAVVALATQGAALILFPLRADFLASTPILLAMAMFIALLAGGSVRQRRERATAERAQIAAQAVTVERMRIAREMHDIVAHTIGVIAIQAGAGSRIFHTQPDKAHDALNAIEATSRETLAGLRRMLGALRTAPADTAPEPGLGEPPSLADLDQLVAYAQRAGVRVDVRWRGERRPLPADVDLTAYRVVQEAVTNVVRHAATHDCVVTVDQRETELALEILDGGRGGADDSGQGYGLIGMRERVGLLHGDLTAGPRPEGGFAVAARLPMPAVAR